MLRSGDTAILYTDAAFYQSMMGSIAWLRIDADNERSSGGGILDAIESSSACEWLAVIAGLRACEGANAVTVFTDHENIVLVMKGTSRSRAHADLYRDVKDLVARFPGGVQFRYINSKSGNVFNRHGHFFSNMQIQAYVDYQIRLFNAYERAAQETPDVPVGEIRERMLRGIL